MAKAPRKSAPTEEETAADSDALNLLKLRDLLGFQMRMAQTAMLRDFLSTLKELDLTQKLTGVLIGLDENPGCSQISLSNLLGADRATIMAMIDRLEERGLIYRTRSRVDRRRQELYLSPAGAQTVARARTLIGEHEARFKALFTETELESLMGFLRRIHERPD